MQGGYMSANLGQLDRTIRIVLGAVLVSISVIFPVVTTGTGKIIVSIIGIIFIVTGLIRY